MNLVHATLVAATLFAAAQAHDGFVESSAPASTTARATPAPGLAVEARFQPTSSTARVHGAGDAARDGMIAASTLSPVGSPSLR